jgi:diguanylate cyclase (GGDEF)-like protein
MKCRELLVAIIFSWGSAALAAAPATLTTLRAIHTLANTEAAKGLPVAFEGTVTYYLHGNIDLFLQDGDLAIYVEAPTGANLVPGDRVLVRGKTRDSFRTDVVAASLTLLHHGLVPKAVPASYKQMMRVERDCMWVTTHATIRSANIVEYGLDKNIYLEMLMDGGYIDATINSDDENLLKNLVDAEVEITGVVSGKFDGKMQMTGILLEVPAISDLKILKPGTADPSRLPVTPMDDILKSYNVRDLTPRVRIQGIVTYYQPSAAVVLQNGDKSLWIETQFKQPLRIGTFADATGFPDLRNGSLALTRAQIQPRNLESPIAPKAITWAQLNSGEVAFDLVSIEGQVLMSVREAQQDEYVLVSDGHLFSSIYRHPSVGSGLQLPPMKEIPTGSRVRVTGISMASYGSDPFHGAMASDVLLRSFDDIRVVATPSWMTVRNLTRVASLLLLMVLTIGAWGSMLKQKVGRQTTTLATRIEAEAILERKRSQILEDINGTRPLTEILEQIAGLVSFSLNGASCWLQIANDTPVGSRLETAQNFTVQSQEIRSRSGPLHGTISAAFDPLAPSPSNASEALSMGAWLATLAIETRGLYSDLLHRSEFDQLTDIHNRFSLDKSLDALIEEKLNHGGIFGLLFIDLDRFKEINDTCGHRIGDIFLQNAALRMKGQLRSVDLLARIGGDEFAVLVPAVRSRAEVEEIAMRLRRSFDAPFAIEDHLLHGSASLGIAIYPDDAATKDGLLSIADTRMYTAKHAARETAQIPAQHPDSSTV